MRFVTTVKDGDLAGCVVLALDAICDDAMANYLNVAKNALIDFALKNQDGFSGEDVSKIHKNLPQGYYISLESWPPEVDKEKGMTLSGVQGPRGANNGSSSQGGDSLYIINIEVEE